MADEQVVPHVVPQETKRDAVVTQVSEEFVVPPSIENAPKEKALMPESQKAVEGIPTKENVGQKSASISSALLLLDLALIFPLKRKG